MAGANAPARAAAAPSAHSARGLVTTYITMLGMTFLLIFLWFRAGLFQVWDFARYLLGTSAVTQTLVQNAKDTPASGIQDQTQFAAIAALTHTLILVLGMLVFIGSETIFSTMRSSFTRRTGSILVTTLICYGFFLATKHWFQSSFEQASGISYLWAKAFFEEEGETPFGFLSSSSYSLALICGVIVKIANSTSSSAFPAFFVHWFSPLLVLFGAAFLLFKALFIPTWNRTVHPIIIDGFGGPFVLIIAATHTLALALGMGACVVWRRWWQGKTAAEPQQPSSPQPRSSPTMPPAADTSDTHSAVRGLAILAWAGFLLYALADVLVSGLRALMPNLLPMASNPTAVVVTYTVWFCLGFALLDGGVFEQLRRASQLSTTRISYALYALAAMSVGLSFACRCVRQGMGEVGEELAAAAVAGLDPRSIPDIAGVGADSACPAADPGLLASAVCGLSTLAHWTMLQMLPASAATLPVSVTVASVCFFAMLLSVIELHPSAAPRDDDPDALLPDDFSAPDRKPSPKSATRSEQRCPAEAVQNSTTPTTRPTPLRTRPLRLPPGFHTEAATGARLYVHADEHDWHHDPSLAQRILRFLTLCVLFNTEKLNFVYMAVSFVLAPYYPLTMIGAWTLAYALYWGTFAGEPSVTGRRAWAAARGARIFDFMASHFPFRLKRDSPTELNPADRYLLGYHPHGILPLTMGWAHQTTQWLKLFPGITPSTLSSTVLHFVPVVRDFNQLLGGLEVSKPAMVMAMEQQRSAILVPGGQKEMLDSCSRSTRIVLNTSHRGFVALAMQTAARAPLGQTTHLVPVFGFGETKIVDNLKTPRSLQAFFMRACRANVLFFPYGWGGLPGVPRPKRLDMVVGAPIAVPRLVEPSREAVEALHRHYHTVLLDLFARHKDSCDHADFVCELQPPLEPLDADAWQALAAAEGWVFSGEEVWSSDDEEGEEEGEEEREGEGAVAGAGGRSQVRAKHDPAQYPPLAHSRSNTGELFVVGTFFSLLYVAIVVTALAYCEEDACPSATAAAVAGAAVTGWEWLW